MKYFEVELENVLVGMVKPHTGGDESFLTENVNLKYSKVKWKYTQQKIGGGSGGGADFHGVYPPTGKEFGPALEMLGFHEITVKDPDKFNFIKGDVMVMEPHTGSKAGHVAGYDGKHWVSDFVQRDFWAGKEYRKERPHYAVYRY